MGESEDCDATVELFEGDQKVKPSRPCPEIPTSMVFVVGALEAISSRPKVNFVMMWKSDSPGREPGASPTTIDWSAIRSFA
jgi:hypothetical protein